MAFRFILPDSYIASNPYLQRARWHDYTDICMYMITLTSNSEWGALSKIITRDSSAASARWSPFHPGKAVLKSVRALNFFFPWVEVRNYTIMPDHVHMMLYVREKTHVHLDQIVDGFVRSCNDILWNAEKNKIGLSLFNPGYNDKIIYKQGQRAVLCDYISENPMRYIIRRRHPEFFSRVNDININGEIFSIYGNFLLLKNPMRSAVRISRKFSHEELTSRYSQWAEIMRGSGVLVSPFYSRNEKRVRDAAIKTGASLIKIIPNGLTERYKPYGKDFRLCSEGRLLIVAPATHSSRKIELNREICLHDNEVAEMIASGALDTTLLGVLNRKAY